MPAMSATTTMPTLARLLAGIIRNPSGDVGHWAIVAYFIGCREFLTSGAPNCWSRFAERFPAVCWAHE
jgi:hypothetical protein